MTKCLINEEDFKLIRRMEAVKNSMHDIILELRGFHGRKTQPNENEVMLRMELAEREFAGAIGYFIAESLIYDEKLYNSKS